MFGDWFDIFVNGLGVAAGLFIVSSGLSILFGVSRLYNFAHGSLYMLGAYISYSILGRLPSGPFAFLAGIGLAALAVACIGAIMEMLVLRRIYTQPHHIQIITTFGIFLIIHDAVRTYWGPVELVSPSIPGFSTPFHIFGHPYPKYYLLMLAVALAIFALLSLVLRRSRWGILLRAAIQDRDMVSALGINQKRLFTSVFVLSAALAGLAGGLDMLRVSASLDMDITLIIDAFAVVVIGGMGSIGGSLAASMIVGLVSAFGTAYFQQLSLSVVYIIMTIVLLIRPEGLLGKKNASIAAQESFAGDTMLRPASMRMRWVWAGIVAGLAVVPLFVGPYWVDVLTETIIYAFFAWTFFLLAGPGGMVSFGQGAFFGLGIYVPALLFKYYGLDMVSALFIAPLASGAAAAFVGWFSVRLVGIYFGMLTLAFGQILWAVTYQWVEVTNGEIGILGIWPGGWASDRRVFYLLTLAIASCGILAMRRLVFTPFGFSLRAGRDAPKRADAIGIDVDRQKWIVFTVAGAMSGLAGVLMLYHEGGAFPSYLDTQASLDVFVMALLGGLQSLSGPIVGALVYRFFKAVLQANFDDWSLIVGVMLIMLALFLPRGLNGLVSDLGKWHARRDVAANGLAGAERSAILKRRFFLRVPGSH